MRHLPSSNLGLWIVALLSATASACSSGAAAGAGDGGFLYADARPGDATPGDGAAGADGGAGGSDAEPGLDGGRDAGARSDVSYNGDFERDPNRVELRGECPEEQRIGGFSVQLNETLGYTAIDGVVRNGVPPNTLHEVVLADDQCRLLRRLRLTCEPPCRPGTTCGTGGTCVPTPVGQDMGGVLLLGLVEPVELRPAQPGNTYFYTRLPHPGLAEGAVVQLTAPAPGHFVPLELYGVGVRQLVPREPRLVLTSGSPLELHWDPPPTASRSTVHVELDIDLHGLTPVLLVCDLPDTGAGTISAAMVDGLVAAGVTGFPEGQVSRRTVDRRTEGAACVDFTVSSFREVELEVTGHIPCAQASDCPTPLTCDLAIQQCRP